jgi:hypothetical protein
LIKPNPKDDPDKRRKDAEFASAVFGPDIDLAGGNTQSESFMGLSDVKHCGKMRALEKLMFSWLSEGDKVLLFSYSVRWCVIIALCRLCWKLIFKTSKFMEIFSWIFYYYSPRIKAQIGRQRKPTFSLVKNNAKIKTFVKNVSKTFWSSSLFSIWYTATRESGLSSFFFSLHVGVESMWFFFLFLTQKQYMAGQPLNGVFI